MASLRGMGSRCGLGACAGRSRLRIDDYPAAKQVVRNQWRETEQRRRRKTSGIRNAARRLNHVAICLGQTVNEFSLRIHRGLFAAIVLRERSRVTQTKVAREIDYSHVRWNS